MNDRIAEIEKDVKFIGENPELCAIDISLLRSHCAFLLAQLREREDVLSMAKEALDIIPERPSPDRYGSDAVIHLYHASPFWELKRKILAHPAMRAGEEER